MDQKSIKLMILFKFPATVLVAAGGGRAILKDIQIQKFRLSWDHMFMKGNKGFDAMFGRVLDDFDRYLKPIKVAQLLLKKSLLSCETC